MIPLTGLAVGNATGRADLARRNQMKAEGAGKTGGLLCVSAPLRLGVKILAGGNGVCNNLLASIGHRG